ncbi:MAG: hypothetical protein DCF25_10195 [Leptolyngbya foveolarum]|uniref:DUF928 domain-containing protein n=1 Tax=Leptolyngbya foveolarum TaxID=47253 RepID=A0A2W4W0V8_9CYAN|nr:MAG: hypothetical protein DCF25_10195 [Leptolyngbya foveolarum]
MKSKLKQGAILLGRGFAITSAVVLLLPTAANAACTRGPNVVVNRGNGASISFDAPVYQAKVFDISKLMLEEIPQQGTQTLILTEVETSQFPGMPQTPTTSLLANTANGCYVFEVSFGNQPVHNTVSAVPEANPELAQTALLPGGEDIDLDTLRAEYTAAVEQHGTDNSFLKRVEQFLTLVDNGTGQRLAAQQAGVEWAHLTQLSGQPDFTDLLDNSFSS